MLNPNRQTLTMSQVLPSNESPQRDFILHYSPSQYQTYENQPDTTLTNLDNEWIILTYTGDSSFSVSRRGYSTIPKLFALMDTTSMDYSGITRIQNQPILDARGQNTLIGIIDTGIDYLNDLFTYTRGISKIESLWDQTVTPETPDAFYGYGTFYSNDDINRALLARDKGENPYAIVNSTDTNGHGTFLAGIAAGREDSVNDFVGAAPDAGLIIVKLRQAKQYLLDYFLVDSKASAYQENDIMLAMHYISHTATRLGKPIVILLGIGTNQGPHTSDTPLARYMNSVARRPNTAVVCCMGNEGNAKHHYQGVKSDSTEFETVEINISGTAATISSAEQKGFCLEVWAQQSELFSVSIISPTGEVIPRIPAQASVEGNIQQFIFERTVITIDYIIIERESGNELIFMRFINPTEGIWRINIFGLSGITGEFNMWLPVTEFLSYDVFFLRPSPDTTLTSPAPSSDAISVGAYNHLTNSIYTASGRGPTLDNRIKPDLVAPGVNVYGPVPGGGYTFRSGTSIAAAHVAGAAALIFSWKIRNVTPDSILTANAKTMLIRGARRENIRSYPNIEWGYGALDLYNSFELLRIK